MEENKVGASAPKQDHYALIELFSVGAKLARAGKIDICADYARAILEEVESIRNGGGK